MTARNIRLGVNGRVLRATAPLVKEDGPTLLGNCEYVTLVGRLNDEEDVVEHGSLPCWSEPYDNAPAVALSVSWGWPSLVPVLWDSDEEVYKSTGEILVHSGNWVTFNEGFDAGPGAEFVDSVLGRSFGPLQVLDQVVTRVNAPNESRRRELTSATIEVNTVARVLMDAWAKSEPKHSITLNPTSYVATFVDMARAVIAERSVR